MDLIQKRFEELAKQASKITASKEELEVSIPSRRSWSDKRALEPKSSGTTRIKKTIDENSLIAWQTSVLALLARVFTEQSPTYRAFDIAVNAPCSDWHSHFDHMQSVFVSAKEQYEGGYLFDVRSLVHAEVFSDELDQAAHFLKVGYKTPAAVTAGVVLETTLRKLCEDTDGVEPADKINKMNDDLAKADVYNKTRADQVRTWAKIRNDAAHGNPDEFDKGEVSRMIEGVRDFVAAQLV